MSYRCKVSLTAVLNSGFLDEVSVELESAIPPDVDPRLILTVPTPPNFNPAPTTVADPGGRPVWPPALASGASDAPPHCC